MGAGNVVPLETSDVHWVAMLFPSVRRLWQRCFVLEADNARLLRTIFDLEQQLLQRMEAPDMLVEYQKSVLVEEPFADGKVPDHLWLTPGEDR